MNDRLYTPPVQSHTRRLRRQFQTACPRGKGSLRRGPQAGCAHARVDDIHTDLFAAQFWCYMFNTLAVW